MDFIPSLENLAFIRLTISLYQNPHFEEIKEKSQVALYHFDIRQCISLLTERLSDSVLPKQFHEKFLDVFEHISTELWYWEREMSRDFGITQQLYFCVNSFGTIDIVETIKRFVRSEDHDIAQRFAMACHFWLTDDALQIWNKSSIYERIDIEIHLLHGQENNNTGPTNEWKAERAAKIHQCLKKWFDWLHEGAYPRTKRKFVNESFFWFSHVPPNSDLLRTLSPEHLQELIELKYQSTEHYGRLYFLYLDYNLKMSFFQQEPGIILKDYLNWPLQSKFLTMANHSWMYMTGKQFYQLLSHISFYKISNRFTNKFDYESLLREFWKQSPLCLKVLAREFHYSIRGRMNIFIRVPECMKTPFDRLMENAPDRSNIQDHQCCRRNQRE